MSILPMFVLYFPESKFSDISQTKFSKFCQTIY